MTGQSDVLRVTLRIDNEFDRNAALIVRSASFFSKLRLNGMSEQWCAHSAAHAHHAAPVASTNSGAHSAAVTGANPATTALPESRTTAASLRGHRNLRGLRHAGIG